MFEIGQIVYHKLTGDRMIVVRVEVNDPMDKTDDNIECKWKDADGDWVKGNFKPAELTDKKIKKESQFSINLEKAKKKFKKDMKKVKKRK